VRRLAERAPELAAEMRGRQPSGTGQVFYRERREIPGISQVFRAQQMPGRRH
jgi:hypothetical protein